MADTRIIRRDKDGLPTEWHGPDPPEAHAPSTAALTREARSRQLDARLRVLGILPPVRPLSHNPKAKAKAKPGHIVRYFDADIRIR